MGTNYHAIGIDNDDPNDIYVTQDAIPGVPLRWSRYATSGSDNTATAAKNIIGYDTSGGTGSFELSTADLLDGQWYLVKDESGDAATNNITVSTEGSETIDGSSTFVINQNNGYALFYNDTANWFVWSTSLVQSIKSFHVTDWTGPFAVDVGANIYYTIADDVVTLTIPPLLVLAATISSTLTNVTALPESLRPGNLRQAFVVGLDNTNNNVGLSVTIDSAGVITIGVGYEQAAFTGAGSLSIESFSMTYNLTEEPA